MKKISIFLLICFFLTGCNRTNFNQNTVPITNGLYFTAKVKADNSVFTYRVEINKDSDIYMEYLPKENNSPAGFDYMFRNDTVIYKYKELVFETEISKLNTSSKIDFIPSVYNYISNNKSEIKYNNQNYLINGESEKYDFTVVFGQTGLPLKIEDHKNRIEVTITDSGIIS